MCYKFYNLDKYNRFNLKLDNNARENSFVSLFL